MRKWLLRILIVIGIVIVLIVGTAAVVLASSPLNRTYTVDVAMIDIPTDAESIARGEHLVQAVAVCTICHGQGLGGQLAFADEFLGQVHTPNLTSGAGGVGATYTDEDWIRAIRHGINPQGRGLIFMPNDSYFYLTDADLGAVIAYIKSLPPVDNTDAARNLTLPAQVMLTLGASGQVMRTELIDHTAPRATMSDGEYLVQIGGCSFCHGNNLAGGQGLEPGAPPGPDLTQGGVLDAYTLAEFTRAVRSGQTLDGRVIDPVYMPWAGYSMMTNEEVEAIWDYLRALS
ncbi:MAG: c-type cytochrome [bacterium]|nr:c-type cytochrome [bacterium]